MLTEGVHSGDTLRAGASGFASCVGCWTAWRPPGAAGQLSLGEVPPERLAQACHGPLFWATRSTGVFRGRSDCGDDTRLTLPTTTDPLQAR